MIMVMSTEENKELFAQAVKKLMKKKSLSTITVSELVDEAQLSRQTFYRYFNDKYDLVNWYFKKLCDSSFFLMGKELTLEEALISKFTFIENEKLFFSAAFKSQDYNSLLKYDYNMIYNFYLDWLNEKTKGSVTSEMKVVLKLYCSGSIALTQQWATGELDITKEEIVKDLILSIPPLLKPYLV